MWTVSKYIFNTKKNNKAGRSKRLIVLHLKNVKNLTKPKLKGQN